MEIINESSLAATIDNLNQLFFEGKKLAANEKTKAAKWIASRQGLDGSYWEMFAPLPSDYKRGIRLFTGEIVTSGAGVGHFLGEESLRALALLRVNDEAVKSAITSARSGLQKAVTRSYSRQNYLPGIYCCAKCSVAYWRNLSSEGVDKNRKILNSGLKYLKSQRDRNGKWKKFPFWYTVLSLSDINVKAASEELGYAEPVLERIAKRTKIQNKYEIRKKALAERVLSVL